MQKSSMNDHKSYYKSYLLPIGNSTTSFFIQKNSGNELHFLYGKVGCEFALTNEYCTRIVGMWLTRRCHSRQRKRFSSVLESKANPRTCTTAMLSTFSRPRWTEVKGCACRKKADKSRRNECFIWNETKHRWISKTGKKGVTWCFFFIHARALSTFSNLVSYQEPLYRRVLNTLISAMPLSLVIALMRPYLLNWTLLRKRRVV